MGRTCVSCWWEWEGRERLAAVEKWRGMRHLEDDPLRKTTLSFFGLRRCCPFSAPCESLASSIVLFPVSMARDARDASGSVVTRSLSLMPRGTASLDPRGAIYLLFILRFALLHQSSNLQARHCRVPTRALPPDKPGQGHPYRPPLAPTRQQNFIQGFRYAWTSRGVVPCSRQGATRSGMPEVVKGSATVPQPPQSPKNRGTKSEYGTATVALGFLPPTVAKSGVLPTPGGHRQPCSNGEAWLLR